MSTKTSKLAAATRTVPGVGRATDRWPRLLAAWRALPLSQLTAAALLVAVLAYVAFVVPAAVTGFVLGFAFVVSLLVVAPLAVLWLVN